MTEEADSEPSSKKLKFTYIESQKNLKDQLKALIQMKMLTEKEVELRMEVVNILRVNLQKKFPACVLYPFNSAVTRLGNKESHLDILVDMTGRAANGESLPEAEAKPPWINEITKILKSICDEGTRRKLFSSITPPTKAHVHNFVATFSKKGRKIIVNLRFNNILSVKRSELINFYMEVEPKVLPLISVVRMWAQFHGIASPNTTSNYAIIYLVLFFLMRKNMIPTVYKLQRLCYFPLTVNGLWNASFNTDINGLNYMKNKSADNDPPEIKVLKLAQNFFEEMSHIDFETYIFCTLTGDILPKSLFAVENADKLPDHFEGYKNWIEKFKSSPPQNESVKNNILNAIEHGLALLIQDPFDLSSTWSLGGSSTRILPKFIQASVKTAKCLSTMLTKNDINLLDMFVDLSKEDKDTEIKDFVPVVLTAKKDEYSPFSFSFIDSIIRDPPENQEYETRLFLPGKKFVEQLEIVLGNVSILQKYPDVVNRLWVCFALEFMSKVWKSFGVDAVEEIVSLDIVNKYEKKPALTKDSLASILCSTDANSKSLDNLFDKTAPAIYSNCVYLYRCSVRDKFWLNRESCQTPKLHSIGKDPLSVEMQITKEVLGSSDKHEFGEAKFFALVKTNCNDFSGELSTPPLIQLVLKIKKSRVVGHDVFRFVKSKFPDLLYSFAVYRFIQTVST